MDIRKISRAYRKSIEKKIDPFLYFHNNIVDISTKEVIYDFEKESYEIKNEIIESVFHTSLLSGINEFGDSDGLTFGYIIANYIPKHTYNRFQISINMLISGMLKSHDRVLKLFLKNFKNETKKTINLRLSTFNKNINNNMMGNSIKGVYGDGDCTNKSNIISFKNSYKYRKLTTIFQDIHPSSESVLSAILTISMMLDNSGFVCIRVNPKDLYLPIMASLFKEAGLWSPPWGPGKIYFIGNNLKAFKKKNINFLIEDLLNVKIKVPNLQSIIYNPIQKDINYLNFFSRYFI